MRHVQESKRALAFQDVLMTLAVSGAVRLEYREDPVGVVQRLGCDASEAALFLKLPWTALERYAQGLLSKRWLEVRRTMPFSVRVFPEIEAVYKGWLQHNPAPSVRSALPPGPLEALRALRSLCSALADNPICPGYLLDLLRFEVLGRCSRYDAEPRTLRSRYAVHEIVATLKEGVLPFDPVPVPTSYRFDRHIQWRTL